MDRVCQVCGIMTALKSPLVVAAKSSTVFGLRRIVFFSDRDVLYSHIHVPVFTCSHTHMMTSMGENGVASCLEVSTMKDYKCHEIASSPLASPLEVNSATAYLLTKAASVLWRTFKYFARDGILLIARMNALALAEINALSLSLVTPSLLSSVKALQMIAGDVGVDYSHDPLAHDSGADDARDAPITSESSVASSREENIDIVQDGLAFQIADFNADAGSQRLDYVITQVDVSRMARVASRDLHAEGVHQPPSKYPADCSLILSSHEEEEQDVDDFLQRNAPIIEVYFESTVHNIDPDRPRHGIDNDPCQFSWMMVPSDIKEDVMTRMSGSHLTGDVPESISICKSIEFVNLKCDDTNTFDHCIICQIPFQDGDGVRVLSCQHLFHRGCIDTRQAGISRSESSGCPVCDEAQVKTMSQQEDSENDFHVEVSPWGLKRLGSLLLG